MPVKSALEVPLKVWSRDEAHALADLGFPNASKLELVDGELIDHMGKKRPHAIWQHLILAWLQVAFGVEYVQMESPIDVAADDNPLIVTVRRSREYETNPSPDELRLVVEVSDSTTQYELQQKAAIYARAGIPDYWVVDIPGKLVHVHRNPAHGAYASITRYGFQTGIKPSAKPDSVICSEKP
jgi:Uma2 family endonuclease